MVENYSHLAEIYDFVMRRVHYDRWNEYLYYVTKEHLDNNPKILEIAAGKGNLTRLFSRYYKGIISTDLSLHMLKKSHYEHAKVCCDMLRLPFKNKFDLVYSTFDSINYLTSKSKLLRMFSEINCVLSETGIFTFDVSMEKNSFKHAEEPVRSGKYKGISYIHKSDYNKISRIHRNTFIMKDNSGREYIEVHHQKIYPFETYFELIPKAGLYISACYKAFSFIDGTKDSERLQFIVKKAGNDAFI